MFLDWIAELGFLKKDDEQGWFFGKQIFFGLNMNLFRFNNMAAFFEIGHCDHIPSVTYALKINTSKSEKGSGLYLTFPVVCRASIASQVTDFLLKESTVVSTVIQHNTHLGTTMETVGQVRQDYLRN